MIARWVEVSSAYLASPRAAESLRADPYWPKWDSPWWHMTLLWELGRADAIPRVAAEGLLAAIEAKYLRFFPNPREPLPEGKDGARDALCHCAVGTVVQVLEAAGIGLEARAPWLRAWLLRYQLPDGGLNCDEKAYAAGGGSSVQSTVAALEAMLGTPRPLTPMEEEFVDRAANYLIERRVVCRRRDGRPMSPDFLKIGFPRFYDYDALRGLAALADWSKRRRARVPRAAIAESMSALAARFPDGVVRVEKSALPDRTTWRSEGGVWSGGHAASAFPLLESCRKPGAAVEALTRSWGQVRSVLG